MKHDDEPVNVNYLRGHARWKEAGIAKEMRGAAFGSARARAN